MDSAAARWIGLWLESPGGRALFGFSRTLFVDTPCRQLRRRKADVRTPKTTLGKSVQAVKNFGAAHIKVATYARVFDGGKDGGPWWERVIRPVNEAGNMEVRMKAELTERLHTIMAPLFKGEKMGGKGRFFPSIGRSLRRQRYTAANT